MSAVRGSENPRDGCERRFDDRLAYEREKAIFIAAVGLVPELLKFNDTDCTLSIQKTGDKTAQGLINSEENIDVQHSILCACLDDLLKFQDRIRDVQLPMWNREKYVQEARTNLEWMQKNWGAAPEEVKEMMAYAGPLALRNTHGDYRAKNIKLVGERRRIGDVPRIRYGPVALDTLFAGERRYITDFTHAAYGPPALDLVKLSYDCAINTELLNRLDLVGRAHEFGITTHEEMQFFTAAEHLYMARQCAESQTLPPKECKQADQFIQDILRLSESGFV